MPGKIFGYEKQVHTGRNSIEDFLEVLKGVFLGPVIWVRGNTVTVYSLFPVLYLLANSHIDICFRLLAIRL